MAWSINKAFILGNVTRDPEMRYTPNGQGVTSFGVATNRRYKDSSGNIQEETQFHEVVAWGKTAEAITQILKKGNKVAVIGRLQTKSWDAPDGSKRSRTEIVLDEFVPLTPKGAGSGGGGEDFDLGSDGNAPEAPTQPKRAPGKKKEEDGAPGDEINLDDIPF